MNTIAGEEQKQRYSGAKTRSQGTDGGSSEQKKGRDQTVPVLDSAIDVAVPKKPGTGKKGSALGKQGMARFENTLNAMKGDIELKDLRKVEGISPMAIEEKENAGEVSIFQKKDYASVLVNIPECNLSYKNQVAIGTIIATTKKIVSTRISDIPRKKHKLLTRAAKLARHLAIIPFIGE